MNVARAPAARARKAVRVPRYVQIMHDLRAGIASGAHPVGRFLPSEADLCRIHDASRFTVREALRRLQDDGIVKRTQGAGSRVIATAPGGLFVQNYRSVGELDGYARATRLTALARGRVRLDDPLAAQVGGVAHEDWAFFRARRHADKGGAPICVLESFMPLRMEPHLPDLAGVSGPVYALLADAAGETVTGATQDTQALAMPGHISDALGVLRGSVSLRILRRYFSAKGTVIATFNWHLGGERYVHRTNLSLSDRQG